MRKFRRRRPDRQNTVRQRLGSGLEALERRQLLTLPPGYYQPYNLHVPQPSGVDLAGSNPTVAHPIGVGPAAIATLDNQGKILRGQDREGDEWEISVKGPGSIIVTDITPNDGVLNDQIDTIQIVGSDIRNTYVEGHVTASARVISDGTIFFNNLFSLSGVHSIVLNGFSLAQTRPVAEGDPNHVGTEIYLPAGVQLLQFHDIQAPIDTSLQDQPMDIVIGEANAPLKVAPIIRLDHIYNTVFDSSATVVTNGTPQVVPSVNIVVNGELKGLDFISLTATPIQQAGLQYQFPTVSTTGRTAVRATSVGNLSVLGTVRNFTVSRGELPFLNGFSGVERINSATFGGTADAVGLDVNGTIGRLRLLRGLGDPTGSQGEAIDAGVPQPYRGYASFGLYGGLITARQINGLTAGPANVRLLTSNDPSQLQYGIGRTAYVPVAGNALTNAAITSDGNIGHTTIVGNAQASEIRSGFHFQSYAQGLEGTRAPSTIGPVRYRGDLINSVMAATYRPKNFIFGDVQQTEVNQPPTTDDEAGPGTIRGQFTGRLYNTGNPTILANQGAGFYARRKLGYLPPPEAPPGIHGQSNP